MITQTDMDDMQDSRGTDTLAAVSIVANIIEAIKEKLSVEVIFSPSENRFFVYLLLDGGRLEMTDISPEKMNDLKYLKQISECFEEKIIDTIKKGCK